LSSVDDQLGLFSELQVPASLRLSRSRLFFALWPDRRLRSALAKAAAELPLGKSPGAYRVKPERLHLTLAFLGELNARQVEAAYRAGDAVRAASFAFRIDHIGHFEAANVAWIGPSTLDAPLARLKAELDRELLHVGLPVDTAAYVPHVTCQRRQRELPVAAAPNLNWSVSDFALMRSCRDASGRPAGYKVLRRWPLLGPEVRRPF
jgi:2'-5' RNA ligase